MKSCSPPGAILARVLSGMILFPHYLESEPTIQTQHVFLHCWGTCIVAGSNRARPPTRWTLARTDEKGVRTLAALLGVRFRVLSDGEFNHTSALILLDAEGRVIARTETLGNKPDPVFLAAVKKTVAAK